MEVRRFCTVETKKNYVKEEVCIFCTVERKKKGYEGGRTQILYFRKEEERISRIGKEEVRTETRI